MKIDIKLLFKNKSFQIFTIFLFLAISLVLAAPALKSAFGDTLLFEPGKYVSNTKIDAFEKSRTVQVADKTVTISFVGMNSIEQFAVINVNGQDLLVRPNQNYTFDGFSLNVKSLETINNHLFLIPTVNLEVEKEISTTFSLDKPTCADGIKNQLETDIDCGGPCKPCMVNKLCSTNKDCETNNCGPPRCIG